MKHLIQYFKTGELELIEAPVPRANPKSLVIQSVKSLISVGTEKMLLDFGKASYLQKAKKQPDKVKQVLDKIKTEGLLTTIDAVWSKLNEPVPLGYSNVGHIVETGNLVDEFETGERVASNGYHAEFVKAPWTLAAKIPAEVSDEEAAFTVPGAICLEGVRLLEPTLGETVVVIGLGLLGQLVSQILQANGCQVISFDIDEQKVNFAKRMGMNAVLSGDTQENINYVLGRTNGIGADGVIITASSAAEGLLSQCALMSRKRGRIVLIGVIPITVPRNLFYEKELQFQVSSAYGPGRYDANYEEKGNDYPLPYVRWTAKRNMEAFLFLLQEKKIDVAGMITHNFDFPKILDAYKAIEQEKPLGIIINYETKPPQEKDYKISLKKGTTEKQEGKAIVGFIGAGNFAAAVLLPALKGTAAQLKMISSSDGYRGTILGKKFDAEKVTSNKDEIFKDKDINTVFIATRHASHADLVVRALQEDKHVFVEKPLALNLDGLKKVYSALKQKTNCSLLVGFNRRFAPLSVKLKKSLSERSDPISIIITVNAGAIPMEHWTQDPEVGGGRIIGEACHFVDLARYFVGAEIESVAAVSTKRHSLTDSDKVMITLAFKDGSHASINYLANGNKKFPKERIEVFSSERIFVIENFKRIKSYGASLNTKSLKQDKGQREEVKQFISALERNETPPIDVNEIIEVHLATLAVLRSLKENKFIAMDDIWRELGK